MALSEEANRILDALRDAGIQLDRWVDDRLIRDTVMGDTRRASALQELADRGYIKLHEDGLRLALTPLGNDVVYGGSFSRQNWKPWRPSF